MVIPKRKRLNMTQKDMDLTMLFDMAEGMKADGASKKKIQKVIGKHAEAIVAHHAEPKLSKKQMKKNFMIGLSVEIANHMPLELKKKDVKKILSTAKKLIKVDRKQQKEISKNPCATCDNGECTSRCF
jgi:hypothetical protein